MTLRAIDDQEAHAARGRAEGPHPSADRRRRPVGGFMYDVDSGLLRTVV